MPYFYDLNRAETTNGSANTESMHFLGKTVANQETLGIYGLYAASRFATAGGAQLRLKTNQGSTASGGTAQTPTPKNIRGSVAAQSLWSNDATSLTSGLTLTTRLSVGFAQTGGAYRLLFGLGAGARVLALAIDLAVAAGRRQACSHR